MIAVLEELRGQHRRQGEGYEQGEHTGKNNGKTKLPEKLTGHGVHEGDRHEYCRIAEGDGDSRHADFVSAVLCCLLRLFPHLQMADDIFQYNY